MVPVRSLRIVRKDGTVQEVPEPDEALGILRHSTSHLLALAVMELYPEVHLGIGPPTSEGFYYDFEMPHRLNDDDLARIEEKMEALRQQDIVFEPEIVEQEESLAFFEGKGERLKAELGLVS